MPYFIIDRRIWDTLGSVKWYNHHNVRHLCAHLVKLDYSKADDRLKAHAMLKKTLESELAMTGIFNHELRFPRYGSYINDSNSKFKQVFDDLIRLLSCHYESPVTDNEHDDVYLMNSDEYRSNVIKLNEIAISSLWSRSTFEATVGIWGTKHNNVPGSYDDFSFKTYQITDLIAYINNVYRQVEEIEATIEYLNTTIKLKDITIEEKCTAIAKLQQRLDK
ncbi:hypothetical protein BDB01DRAFT_838801 [Pilobolus umbonatus]|nr:hypothetical protein BDB01DRAFT_838801 [Pilobolus umbonatus]